RLFPRHQQHSRGAVGDLRRVSGGDETTFLERGLELREYVKRRARADPLVGRVNRAVDPERHDLAPETPLLGRARSALVRAHRDLVAFAARDAPLLRNQLGADALVDDAVALEKLRRVRRAVVLGDLAGRCERDVAHVLHAATDGDVVYAGRDQRGREVHRLLRRGALAVDGRGWRRDREPSLQPGVAADVVRLLAVLLHAAGEHILDRL